MIDQVRLAKRKIQYQLACRQPVCKKRIVFEAYQGKRFACSPKALYYQMLEDKRFEEYEFIWIFREPEKYRFLRSNRNTKVVRYLSADYFQAYATAAYWITNSTTPVYMTKRAGQHYIQTWHGTPLKRLGLDLEKEGNQAQKIEAIHRQYRREGQKMDVLLSPSAFTADKLRSAFGIEESSSPVVLETGYPRNDALFQYSERDIVRIKRELGIPQEKKVILYAPTFRDDCFKPEYGFTYEPVLHFQKLQQELGADYVILFRAHYLVANAFHFEDYQGFVYDVSCWDDINELYIISDMLITDYSSVFFDYANLKRPILFFMYDYERYKEEMRDFYINIEELPGPVIQNQQELAGAIRSLEENFDAEAVFHEFEKTYTYLDNAQSSQRVIEEIQWE
ncbi:MAG: CDP-glycerol glycerophosphotransferase family protein, partial [Lachnospiraceae bacterium]